jgi:hypothetical protein
MLIFVDDSGDPGIKLNSGSSRFFVLSAIKFIDNLDAEEASLVLKRYKRKIRMLDNQEIKFNQLSMKRRVEILDELKNIKINIFAVYFDKEENILENNLSYINYMKTLFKKYEKDFLNNKIIIDGGHERIYQKDFFNKITDGTKISTKEIRMKDSKSNTLLQLADIFAGAVHFGLKNNKDYLSKYKKEIISL